MVGEGSGGRGTAERVCLRIGFRDTAGIEMTILQRGWMDGAWAVTVTGVWVVRMCAKKKSAPPSAVPEE